MLRVSHPHNTAYFIIPPATTQIYTLSLHDALPIYGHFSVNRNYFSSAYNSGPLTVLANGGVFKYRSEEDTSELQSQSNVVCRLLLEKKKKVIAGTVG